MNPIQEIFHWFAGGGRYMTLEHCMDHDVLWIAITVTLDMTVALGYGMIAYHWWKNQKTLEPGPARDALGHMRNIFVFCGICGYLFIPIKMVWPGWRLYDGFLLVLAYYTWKYAWGARELKVVYRELGRAKQLQQDLEDERAQTRRRTFFLNAVGHDLRNPLNAVKLQSQVAQMQLKQGDVRGAQETINGLGLLVNGASDLLNDLLELGRLDWAEDPPQPELVELDTVVRGVMETHRVAAERKGLTLSAGGTPGLVVNTDRRRLTRALSNLVGNAVKYTETGGVRIEAGQNHQGIDLHVIDTGVGIPPHLHGRLFDEFFQVNNPERDRAKGFGFGLAIAKRLVEQVGGRIAVASQVGSGSRFTIHLPEPAAVAPGPDAGGPRLGASVGAGV